MYLNNRSSFKVPCHGGKIKSEKEMVTMEDALVTSVANEEQREQLVQMVASALRRGIKIVGRNEKAGQRVIDRGPELVNMVIDDVRELSLELPEMPCFGIADWQKFYKIALTPQQLKGVGDFPWSDAILNSRCPFNPGKMVRETHFAFVGVDTVSVMELQKLNPSSSEPRFYNYAPDSWYSDEKFADEKLRLCWYLGLKDIVPNSENKLFDEQEAMLPAEYEVPTAVAETTKDFLVYKKTGVYVNPYRWARTATLDSGRRRVYVGHCIAGGVDVYRWFVGRYDSIGVGAFRKFGK